MKSIYAIVFCFCSLCIFQNANAQVGSDLLIKANRATLQRQYTLAINYYNQYIKLNPKDFRGYFNRGTTEYNAGLYKEAVQDFTKTLDYNPIYKEAYYYRGQTFAELKNYNAALIDYNYVLKKDSFNVPFLKLRSEAYAKLNKQNQALTDLNNAISVDRLSGDLYKRRAELKVEMKDVNGALRDYSSVEKLLPSYKMVHYLKGSLYLELRETEFACEELKEALENNVVVAEYSYNSNCKS